MKPTLDNALPIFEQIAEILRRDIVAGRLPPGARVLPVRELALDYGVNPNTMQRALALLEAERLLVTERTAGRYVTEDTAAIDTAREALHRQTARDYAAQMKAAGLTCKQATELITKHWEE